MGKVIYLIDYKNKKKIKFIKNNIENFCNFLDCFISKYLKINFRQMLEIYLKKEYFCNQQDNWDYLLFREKLETFIANYYLNELIYELKRQKWYKPFLNNDEIIDILLFFYIYKYDKEIA